MADRVPPIARIHLARSVPRLLLAPLLVGLAGGAAMAFGLLAAAGPAGIALAVIGGVLLVGALVGALVLLSVHVDVEESAVVVTRIGGVRRHLLTPGPVTRVRVRGPNAARLRVRSGALGWGIGRARLRDEEEIALVRLAPTPTVILIPTEHGRLALAPASDEELLDALSRAAQARQRTEEVTSAMPAPQAEPEVPAATALPEPPAQPEPPPVPMTGIERALLEERLAREHADEERTREEVAAAMAASAAAAEAAGAAAEAEPVAQIVVHPAVEAAGQPVPLGRARRWVAATSFVLLPTAAAAIVLALGVTMGEIPAAGSDVARITALALVLAGPATSIGAVMALAWWPRIVGIVVAGGLAAAVFIGRSLIGG
ncbi:MAG TPA: hypothetical protein VFW95_13155 [Candidatus Limnocylindria bacterium]|nr:hypothetical protein [Candidatus Limnocylindria bacterium]